MKEEKIITYKDLFGVLVYADVWTDAEIREFLYKGIAKFVDNNVKTELENAQKTRRPQRI